MILDRLCLGHTVRCCDLQRARQSNRVLRVYIPDQCVYEQRVHHDAVMKLKHYVSYDEIHHGLEFAELRPPSFRAVSALDFMSTASAIIQGAHTV